MGLWIFFLMAISPIILCMLLWWRFDKSVIYKKTKSKTIKIISTIIFCLIPTYDIVLIKIFGTYYRETTPQPFLDVNFTKPISVYFQNNISPYTQKGLKICSRSLLFDEPIQNAAKINAVALNGDDGKIYLYYFDTNSSEYRDLSQKISEFYILRENERKARAKFNLVVSDRNNIGTKKHTDALDFWHKESNATSIAKRKIDELKEKLLVEKVITSLEIEKLDYIVKLDQIDTNKFISKFIYVNEIKVIDSKASKLVGYNQHLYRHLYNIFPFGGGDYVEMYEKNAIKHNIFDVCNLSE